MRHAIFALFVQKRQQDIPFTIGGWTGDIKSEKGGASLKFEGIIKVK